MHGVSSPIMYNSLKWDTIGSHPAVVIVVSSSLVPTTSHMPVYYPSQVARVMSRVTLASLDLYRVWVRTVPYYYESQVVSDGASISYSIGRTINSSEVGGHAYLLDTLTVSADYYYPDPGSPAQMSNRVSGLAYTDDF